MCKVCKVPLCTKLIKGETPGSKTHFEKWHVVQDLVREAKRCNFRLADFRDTTTNAGEEQEKDSEETDSDET